MAKLTIKKFRAIISEAVPKKEYCQVILDETKLKSFLYAVKNHYWYQMYVDDLPMWGIVGEMSEEKDDKLFVWTHKKIEIGYNNDQVWLLWHKCILYFW